MRHCHFMILSNEILFLKQKLPFLYENFDQLIFYDLNIYETPFCFSTDGSHEYIKEFPDPENKITLIEQTDIAEVATTPGVSNKDKRRMFIYGSRYVKDDIDVFWCTDADEFFNASLIKKVERVFTNSSIVNSITINQYYFWKSPKFIVCFDNNKTRKGPVRIARHKKGNIYGHCSLNIQYPPDFEIKDEMLYHFSCIGDNRVKVKSPHYPFKDGYWDLWDNFDETKVGDEIYGYPHMHPNPTIQAGITRYYGEYPDYIDLNEIGA